MDHHLIYDLLDEKALIMERITKKPNNVHIDSGDKRLGRFAIAFGVTKENRTSEVMHKVQSFMETAQGIKEQFLHDLDALSLYKAAYVEHQKLMAADNVPEAVKQVSTNNIRLYEDAMRKQGITDDMMMGTIVYEDYGERLCDYYARISFDKMNELASENGFEFGPALPTLHDAFRRATIGLDTYEPAMPTELDEDQKDLYGALAASGVPYFKSLSPIYKNNAGFVYGDEPMRCFELRDGRYVPKPYPQGFFKKIGYFFTKLVHGGAEQRKIDEINRTAERELNDTPDDVREAPIVAELHALDREQMDLTQETLEERFVQHLKEGMEPSKEPEPQEEPSPLDMVD